MSFWTNPMRRNPLSMEVRAANLAADERIRLRAEIGRLKSVMKTEANLLQAILCNPEGNCCIDGSNSERECVTSSLNRLLEEGDKS